MDKIQARAKIKAHIKKKGLEEDFVVTETLVMHWWHWLNKAIFDDVLTPPKRIEIRKFHGCLGWCKPLKRNRQVVLGISSGCYDRKTLLTVLSHEMVHTWEHQELGKMSHGYSFYGWQKRIKTRVNLELNEFI